MFLEFLSFLSLLSVNPYIETKYDFSTKDTNSIENDVDYIKNNDTYELSYMDNNIYYFSGESYDEIDEQNALNISPENYHKLDNYNSIVDGFVNDYMPKYMYFKCLTSSSFSIDFSFKDTYAYSHYDFYVYYYDLKYNSNEYNTCNRIELINNVYESKQIHISPGTYYISIIPKYNSSDMPSKTFYNLSLKIEKSKEKYDNAEIKNMAFNKKLLGAVWISDFNPFDLVSLDQYNSYTYYDWHSTNLSHPNYALDDLMKYSEGGKINVASFYLWDSSIKDALYKVLSSIEDKLLTECKNIEKIIIEKTILYEKISRKIKIFLSILNKALDKIVPQYEVVIDAGTDITTGIIDYFLSSLIPQKPVDKENYLAILGRLNLCLHNSPQNETIVINKFYKLRTEESDLPNLSKKYIDYNYFDYMADTSFIYCKDDTKSINEKDENDYNVIYSNICKQSPKKDNVFFKKIYGKDKDEAEFGEDYYNNVRGKIYAISGYNDIWNINDLPLVSDMIDYEPEPINLSLDGIYQTGYFSNGEYKWYSFQPTSSGKYYLNIHTSNFDILEIDIFKNPVPLNSYSDLIYKITNENFYTINGDRYIIIDFNTEENQTIYFRLHASNYDMSNNNYVLQLTNTNIYSQATHVHIFNSPTYHTGFLHKYTCSCGYSYVEVHCAEASNPYYCTKCFSKVKRAVIGTNSIIDDILCDDEDIGLIQSNKKILYYKKEEIL